MATLEDLRHVADGRSGSEHTWTEAADVFHQRLPVGSKVSRMQGRCRLDSVRIGELGDRCAVTVKTIRYYESIGLLDEPERTASGYREYLEDDVERLRFIRDAQATGLTLAEIASVLELKGAGERSCSHTVALVEAHVASIDAQMKHLADARRELSLLAERAKALDPASCTDPNRCQVISNERRMG